MESALTCDEEPPGRAVFFKVDANGFIKCKVTVAPSELDKVARAEWRSFSVVTMALSRRCSRLFNRCSHLHLVRPEHFTLTRTLSASSDYPYFALFYDYVDDILEKRTPVRPEHLKHITAYVDDGRCKLGGAFADNNVDGALCIFQCKDISEVEDFARRDPYVKAGLVTNYKIRPWTVVAGSLLK